jgi:hypothetical protein
VAPSGQLEHDIVVAAIDVYAAAGRQSGRDLQWYWIVRLREDLVNMSGPRELVRGQRESFIGRPRWPRSRPAVGSPGPNVGGGGTWQAG